jgi:hypothetical protein
MTVPPRRSSHAAAPSDFERLFAPGARHVLSGGQVVMIRLRQDDSLWLPSGKVVAGEPAMFEAMADSSFVQRVPPGRYPLVLVTAVFGEDPDDPDADAMLAAARPVLRAVPAIPARDGDGPDGAVSSPQE